MPRVMAQSPFDVNKINRSFQKSKRSTKPLSAAALNRYVIDALIDISIAKPLLGFYYGESIVVKPRNGSDNEFATVL